MRSSSSGLSVRQQVTNIARSGQRCFGSSVAMPIGTAMRQGGSLDCSTSSSCSVVHKKIDIHSTSTLPVNPKWQDEQRSKSQSQSGLSGSDLTGAFSIGNTNEKNKKVILDPTSVDVQNNDYLVRTAKKAVQEGFSDPQFWIELTERTAQVLPTLTVTQVVQILGCFATASANARLGVFTMANRHGSSNSGTSVVSGPELASLILDPTFFKSFCRCLHVHIDRDPDSIPDILYRSNKLMSLYYHPYRFSPRDLKKVIVSMAKVEMLDLSLLRKVERRLTNSSPFTDGKMNARDILGIVVAYARLGLKILDTTDMKVIEKKSIGVELEQVFGEETKGKEKATSKRGEKEAMVSEKETAKIDAQEKTIEASDTLENSKEIRTEAKEKSKEIKTEAKENYYSPRLVLFDSMCGLLVDFLPDFTPPEIELLASSLVKVGAYDEELFKGIVYQCCRRKARQFSAKDALGVFESVSKIRNEVRIFGTNLDHQDQHISDLFRSSIREIDRNKTHMGIDDLESTNPEDLALKDELYGSKQINFQHRLVALKTPAKPPVGYRNTNRKGKRQPSVMNMEHKVVSEENDTRESKDDDEISENRDPNENSQNLTVSFPTLNSDEFLVFIIAFLPEFRFSETIRFIQSLQRFENFFDTRLWHEKIIPRCIAQVRQELDGINVGGTRNTQSSTETATNPAPAEEVLEQLCPLLESISRLGTHSGLSVQLIDMTMRAIHKGTSSVSNRKSAAISERSQSNSPEIKLSTHAVSIGLVGIHRLYLQKNSKNTTDPWVFQTIHQLCRCVDLRSASERQLVLLETILKRHFAGIRVADELSEKIRFDMEKRRTIRGVTDQ